MTWYLKALAVLIFIAIFIIGFKLGYSYKQVSDSPRNTSGYCNNSRDCAAGESCLQSGPLRAGYQNQKRCVPPGYVVPL